MTENMMLIFMLISVILLVVNLIQSAFIKRMITVDDFTKVIAALEPLVLKTETQLDDILLDTAKQGVNAFYGDAQSPDV